MKKIVFAFALLFLLSSCDDGGFSIDNFDFSNVNAAACNENTNQFFLHYISGNEVLILQIPSNAFPNEITQPDQPRIVNISGTNRVLYRIYSDNVTASQICTTIPPATPVVREEWNAVSGIISIQTFTNRTNNETTGQSFISGYTHLITLVNANFEKASGEQQLFAELTLGDYTTPASPPNIPQTAPLQNCQGNFRFIFKNSLDQAILLALPETLIQNEVTLADTPRTAAIDQNNTAVFFRIYNLGIPNPATFFCNGATPLLPEGNENWIGRSSTSPDNGIVEVVTTSGFNTQGEPIFSHEILLRRVRFQKGAVDFTFGNLHSLGIIVTNP
jgi:hypothetical protein